MEDARLVVVDAVRDEDLIEIGAAADGLALVTGGSGVALGLPANFRRRGLLASRDEAWTGQPGKCVALSGSCSAATLGQVARHRETDPAFAVAAADVIEGRCSPDAIADRLMQAERVPLAYSSADLDAVRDVQGRYGWDGSAAALEDFFADVARALVARGVQRIVTAGGETSGAVVEALGLRTLEIGPEINPGVPALRAGPHLVMALKSGDFGAPDFFVRAARVIGGGS